MKVDVTYLDGSTKFTLLEPVEIDGWDIPEGYCSDGCSVPRWLWWYCSPFDGRYMAVFVWHDWAYDNAFMSRDSIDLQMRDLLIEAGMPRPKAWTIYLAVKLFGESHFSSM